MYSGYHQILNSQFLALSNENAICEEVPLEITAKFLADNNGNWEGYADFDYSRAIYTFSFNRLRTSESNFANIVDIAMHQVDIITDIMKQNNMALTILYWTTWAFVSTGQNFTGTQLSSYHDNNEHKFYLTGELLSTSIVCTL